MALKKATKEQSKLRLAIYGLSGGGKTYSALAIAKGITEVFGGKIAMLDTEFRSASKYANIFDFETDDFGEPTIENYLAFIEMVKENPDITVLIIDSLTHAWQWCLGEVDRLTKGSSKNDNRNAWRVVSPKYDKLVNAIISAPFHVIGTMRAKTEWSSAKENESKASHRETLAPVQRDGFEYEFDMLMEVNANHFGTIIKDRSSKFQDEVIEKPGINLGKKLAEWLKDGVASTVKPIQQSPQTPSAALSRGNTQTTDKPRSERQKVIDDIAAIFKTLSPDGTEFFSNDEKDNARHNISEIRDLKVLKELASMLQGLLEKRKAEYILIPFGDDPAPETTAEAQPPHEDGFVDDIPWGEGEEPGKGKKGKAGKQKTAPENETADGELPIY